MNHLTATAHIVMKKLDRAKAFCQKSVSIFAFFVDGSLFVRRMGKNRIRLAALFLKLSNNLALLAGF